MTSRSPRDVRSGQRSSAVALLGRAMRCLVTMMLRQLSAADLQTLLSMTVVPVIQCMVCHISHTVTESHEVCPLQSFRLGTCLPQAESQLLWIDRVWGAFHHSCGSSPESPLYWDLNGWIFSLLAGLT